VRKKRDKKVAKRFGEEMKMATFALRFKNGKFFDK